MRSVRSVSVASCVLVGLLGCAELGARERVLYEDSKLTVSVVPDSTVDGSMLHDHPVQIELDEMKWLLEGVQLERSPGLVASMVLGLKREAAFQRAEIEALGPKLRPALAQASERERVAFVITRAASSQPSEVFEWALWIHRDQFHLALTHHRYPMDRQQSEQTATLEGFATRSPSTPRNLPGDVVILFQRPEYVIAQEPGLATEMFGNPQAHLIVDHRRFFADVKQAGFLVGKTPAGSTPAPTPAGSGGATHVVQGASSPGSARGQPGDSDAQLPNLSERVKTLETQVNDLLSVVKQLTTQLADSNKALAAREQELRTLKSAPNRGGKPRSSQSPSVSP